MVIITETFKDMIEVEPFLQESDTYKKGWGGFWYRFDLAKCELSIN